MTEERFNELVGRWIDGEVAGEDGRLLAESLRADPSRVERMREELQFADLLEQQLVPGRSFESFVNGLETRMHAERTAEQFVAELIPKLREVDSREVERGKVVSMRPGRGDGRRIRTGTAGRWVWASVAGGLAAAAAVMVLVVVIQGKIDLKNGGPAAVASITEMEGVVWYTDEGVIEWRVGDQVKAGDEIRMVSGRARFEMSNGNVLTVEGPAALQLLSESEGVLRRGALLADVKSGGEPFRLHGLGAEIAVEPGTMGVRTLEGDRFEAKMLTRAEQRGGAAGPRGEEGQEPGMSRGSVEARPAGEPAGEGEESRGIPGALPHYQIDGEGAPVLLVLEDDDFPTVEPIRVDVVPGGDVDLSMASHLRRESRPAIESVSRVRSYLVQVGDAGGASSEGKDYVDATVRFDRPILGISAMEETGEAGASLSGYEFRPLLGPGGEWKRGLKPPHDFYHIREDGRTLDLRVRKQEGGKVPQLRVFVEGE